MLWGYFIHWLRVGPTWLLQSPPLLERWAWLLNCWEPVNFSKMIDWGCCLWGNTDLSTFCTLAFWEWHFQQIEHPKIMAVLHLWYQPVCALCCCGLSLIGGSQAKVGWPCIRAAVAVVCIKLGAGLYDLKDHFRLKCSIIIWGLEFPKGALGMPQIRKNM